MMMAAERPRPVACAVRNLRNRQVLVEQGLGAAEVVGHGQNLAADRLGMLDVGIGHEINDCSIMARVRVKNRSRPRSSVVLATTATSTVGTAAMTANRPTICT